MKKLILIGAELVTIVTGYTLTILNGDNGPVYPGLIVGVTFVLVVGEFLVLTRSGR